MAWFRIQLTQEQQQQVQEQLHHHPHPRVREKMLVLWLLHCQVTRQQAAQIVGIARSTVQRHVEAFRNGGLDGLRQWNVHRPVSDMATHRQTIRQSFEQQPVSTIPQACERIHQLTGLRRSLSQVRHFLKSLGMKWQRIRAIPVPPKKTCLSTWKFKPGFATMN